MNKVVFSFMFFCFLSEIHHSSAQIAFHKTFGGSKYDVGYSIKQTMDGGFIIAGVTQSFGNSSKAYLIKTDSVGAALWSKNYGDVNDSVNYGLRSVHQTADGGYVASGSSSANGGDLSVMKTDSSGIVVWSKAYGTAGGNDAGKHIRQSTFGGYLIIGQVELIGAGAWDFYMIHTDSLGNFWMNQTYGGGLGDFGQDVLETSTGDFVAIGSTESFGVGGTCGFVPCKDVYFIKALSNGLLLTGRTFGGAGDDYATSIQETADGGFIIAGYTSSFGVGLFDVYLIKTDAIGDTLWTRTYGGAGNDYARSVLQTSDGGYIIAGYTSSFGLGGDDIYLIKTDSIGDTIWAKVYGGSGIEYGNSVIQTDDGGYLIIGQTNSFGAGEFDVYMVKTDVNGNSGCNQSSTGTIVGSTLTQIGIGGSSSAGGVVYSDVSSDSNSATLDSMLCITCNLSLVIMGSEVSCTGGNNGAVNLSVSGGSAPYSYTWSTGDTTTDIFNLTSGTYFVTVTDFNGCLNIDSVSISEPLPIANTNVSIAICNGDSLFIGGGYQTTGGTYYDTLTAVNGCDSVIITTLTINPAIALTTGSLPDTSNSSVGMAWVTVSGGTPPYSYQWGGSTDVTTDTATGLISAIYSIAVTDSNGCMDSATVTVGNVTAMSESAISDQQSLIIYPNPTTGRFTLEMNLSEQTAVNINLYHFTGQLIRSEKIGNVSGNRALQIDLSGYAKGVYFIQISTGNSILTRKVVL